MVAWSLLALWACGRPDVEGTSEPLRQDAPGVDVRVRIEAPAEQFVLEEGQVLSARATVEGDDLAVVTWLVNGAAVDACADPLACEIDGLTSGLVELCAEVDGGGRACVHGRVDPCVEVSWYPDDDGDGFGDPHRVTWACEGQAGWLRVAGDCDDADAGRFTGARETCDGSDEDCDGSVDEGVAGAALWYRDLDGDGFGARDEVVTACLQPAGHVTLPDDCDDARAEVHPRGTERCNGVDDDCDGTIDEPDAVDATLWYGDGDGDGWGDASSAALGCSAPTTHVAAAGDCDDADASDYPGATEVCDGDDDDCDGVADESDAADARTWFADLDGDGAGDASRSAHGCLAPPGHVLSGNDCDDADAAEFPGASERCDGDDDDCDGFADEEDSVDALTWYLDGDRDGYGTTAVTRAACLAPTGWVGSSVDCDDFDADVHPDASEYCNAADDDCDGTVDEDDAVDAPTWYRDGDGDGYGDDSTPHVACADPGGYVRDALDCDDADADEHLGAMERCDGDDDDCDGLADEDDAVDVTPWFLDLDGDGTGDAATERLACSPGAGYVADGTDCDDLDASERVGAAELCDGDDDDCDGVVDEDDAADAPVWYADGDGDGFGDAASPFPACEVPSGFVADATDCDDFDALTLPGGIELCGGGDEDCDGAVDESDASDATTWYRDADGDGAGDATVSRVACVDPGGYVRDALDCDDTDATEHVGAVERCDGDDDDCDGATDEDDAIDVTTWYLDLDGDGTGDPAFPQLSCSPAAGYVADGTDCDDLDASERVGAAELCDGDDDDCDNTVDEDDAVDAPVWYVDVDGDGFGDAGAPTFACDAPSGYVSNATDCDDFDAQTVPGGIERCGGADEDCDGEIDEDDAIDVVWSCADADGDGYGDPGVMAAACTLPEGHVYDADDCDDTDAATYPGAVELADGVDEDCDGLVDDMGDPWEVDLVDNGSFETGDLTGWTSAEGACDVLGDADLSWASPYDGDWLLHGGDGYPGDCLLTQDVDLLALGFAEADLDGGFAAVDAVGALAHYMDTFWGDFGEAFFDRALLRVRFLDEAGAELGSVRSLLSEEDSWDLRGFGGQIPTGTRSLRVEVEAQWWRGADNDALADAVAASIVVVEPVDPSITLTPILQDPGADSVRVLWETDGNACEHAVSWRPADGSAGWTDVTVVDTVQVDETHFVHVATIEGLTPATEYEYNVASGATTSSTYTFTSTPNPGDAVRFAWVSDPDGAEARLAPVLADLRAHDPDVVVAAGDVVWNGDEVDDWHDEWWDPLSVDDLAQTTPVLFARGNHDAEHALSYAYSALPGNERWYTFTFGDVFVVVMDTESPTDGPDDRIDQRAFLEEALASDGALAADFQIAVFHIAPYTYTRHDNWQLGSRSVQRDWVPLFEDGGVDIVVGGHFGSYQRGDLNGVIYTVIGGGGGVIDRESTGDALWMDVVERTYHYVIMDVSGGTLTWTAYDLDGDVLDTFTITP